MPSANFDPNRSIPPNRGSKRVVWIIVGVLAAGFFVSVCCLGGLGLAWWSYRSESPRPVPQIGPVMPSIVTFPERVTPQNYDKIKLGVTTYEEVEAILGPKHYELRDDIWDPKSRMYLYWENSQTDIWIKVSFEKYPPTPTTKVQSTGMHTP
jgi:hypothetical protein